MSEEQLKPEKSLDVLAKAAKELHDVLAKTVGTLKVSAVETPEGMMPHPSWVLDRLIKTSGQTVDLLHKIHYVEAVVMGILSRLDTEIADSVYEHAAVTLGKQSAQYLEVAARREAEAQSKLILPVGAETLAVPKR
jgi:hypothetical protein